MARGKSLHRQQDGSNLHAGLPTAASGKAAAHRALRRGELTKSDYVKARAVLEHADRSKHVHRGLPLDGPRALRRPVDGSGAGNKSWADI
eukprot:5149157-Pyramimonas_sp.AAC.1